MSKDTTAAETTHTTTHTSVAKFDELVEFSVGDERFDKNTYWGRVGSISASISVKLTFQSAAGI